MATKQFNTGFQPKLPGKVRTGSQASFRKSSTLSARGSMAKIIAEYEKIIRALESATPTFLFNAMQPVLNRSQVYVPKKTGKLMDSVNLQIGTQARGRVEVVMTYGNEEVPYASLVHEMVWLNHNYPTRAKYLQSALEEEMDSFLVSLAADYATML